MPGRIFPLFYHSCHSPSSSTSSLESVTHPNGIKRPASHENSRPSLPQKAGSPRSAGSKPSPATLSMTIESPPLVSYGPPKDSTGALLSGLLHLDVREMFLNINSLEMVLVAEVVTRRPITAQCPECNIRSEILHKWSIVAEPKQLGHGVSTYPFSYHVPGNLPATNTNVLGKIRYVLKATAEASEADDIKFQREIVLSRSILPGQDRQSTRIFPPTNLTANIQLPSVVHTGGDFPLSIRLNGVTSPEKETRWKLKKVTWRIDEHSTVISPACSHHCSKIGDGKGILHEDVRAVGSGEMKTGWKANYDNANGKIEMELLAGIPAHLDAACNVESECGIKVTHNLVVELIVSEEHCPTNPTKLVTPTGAARVLRMQLSLHVTSRGGLGISWDEEQPPIYENVPPAPPTYNDPPSANSTPPLSPALPPVYFEGIPPI